MSLEEINAVCVSADMIVCGYAFSRIDGSKIRVVQLQSPNHALVLSSDGEVLETTMDDVELDIIKGYWAKNHKYMEESYAEVL